MSSHKPPERLTGFKDLERIVGTFIPKSHMQRTLDHSKGASTVAFSLADHFVNNPPERREDKRAMEQASIYGGADEENRFPFLVRFAALVHDIGKTPEWGREYEATPFTQGFRGRVRELRTQHVLNGERMLRYIYSLLSPDADPKEVEKARAGLSELLKQNNSKPKISVSSPLLLNFDPQILLTAASLVKAHHERWDGGGYPNGLQGTKIPFGSRIIAVSESYDSLRRGRHGGRVPARPPMSHSEAMKEIRMASGTKFDPHVVEALERVATRCDNWDRLYK